MAFRLKAALSLLTAAVSLHLLATGIAAQRPAPMIDALSADLARLVQTQGVAGFERDVAAAVASLLPPWAKPVADEAGNLVLTIGEGSPHVLLTAPLDEDGFIVSDMTDDGFLRLHRVTTGARHRLYEQFHYGQPVVIRTARGALIPGVTATISTHLARGAEPMTTPRGLGDLWVDVGVERRAEAEKLGIKMLDTVALRERFQALSESRVAGVAAQARGGALALANVLRAYDQKPASTGTITFAWVAQTVFGDRGHARLARRFAPDRVVAVVRTAPTREADAHGDAGVLGDGPLVASQERVQEARQKGISAQSFPGLRGPAAWPAPLTQAVALPVRFAQTPVEMVDLADVAQLTDLLRSLAGLPEDGKPRGVLEAPATVAGGAPGAFKSSAQLARPFFRTLAPLIETYGVSGAEAAVRERIQRQLPAWAKPETDQAGNLTVTFGQGSQELLFVAHMDEIGYQVAEILEDGSAAVRKLGGFMDLLLEAHPVLVHTARGPVPALVAPRPNYMSAETAAPTLQEIRVHFGTTTRQQTAALGVAKGDGITVRKQLVPLAGLRATARSLDDRCGVAVLIEAMGRLDPAKVPNRVTFAWVVGEETGLVGAGALAERIHPPRVFAVDTFVSSDSPIDPKRMANIALGSGAVLRAIDNSSITPPEVLARVTEVALANRIRVWPGTTGGGNDGSQFSRFGSAVIPISWPGRYSHSPVEVADARDLDALVDLVVALVRDTGGPGTNRPD
ncbi:MAG: M20/M25/M40 family metallo-hydrolase [Vicinamibacterales bacterium]